MRKRLALAVFGASVLLPGTARQVEARQNRNFVTGTRSLKGTVSAKSKPLDGAVVLIKDTKTLQVRSFVTANDGQYRFYGLSTNDEYEIRAQYRGAASGVKILSAFDSHKESTIDIKIK